MLILAASAYEIVLAVHVMAIVIAFGWTFALPVVYIVAGRHDPRSLPVLHRIEYTIERFLVNPALVVILGAGIFLASDGHHWSEFFVQWGLGAVIVIGALVGSVMIPTAKRAEQLARAAAERATASAGVSSAATAAGAALGPPATSAGAAAAAGSMPAEEIVLGEDYEAVIRRLNVVGSLLSLLVLVTILFMVVKP
jgi:uncharacterized membrane protein